MFILLAAVVQAVSYSESGRFLGSTSSDSAATSGWIVETTPHYDSNL